MNYRESRENENGIHDMNSNYFYMYLPTNTKTQIEPIFLLFSYLREF